MTQAEAYRIMYAGHSVFLTGAPGAGKTYTLQFLIDKAKEAGKNVAITASTGIAASHIGGTTIHSFTGIGIKTQIDKRYVANIKRNERTRERIKECDVLVIDEVSMISGNMLNMINAVMKGVRGDKRPFGGVQVVLVGDLFQLPPVNRENDLFDFAHESDSWKQLNPTICYLTEQHRQEGSDGLLSVLIGMRAGEVPTAAKRLLAARIAGNVDENITKLYSHNADVDTINNERLARLPGDMKRYGMNETGDEYKVQALKRSILAPEVLELKVGAEVMFVANHRDQLYVNGTRGRIVSLSGDPIVETMDGRHITASPFTWRMEENYQAVAKVTQYPLRLAYAITIHKSQGMSLDAAVVDLSRAFTPGMGYVALSRVRSLDGLHLLGINDMALRLNEQIFEFDKQLLAASGVIQEPVGQVSIFKGKI